MTMKTMTRAIRITGAEGVAIVRIVVITIEENDIGMGGTVDVSVIAVARGSEILGMSETKDARVSRDGIRETMTGVTMEADETHLMAVIGATGAAEIWMTEDVDEESSLATITTPNILRWAACRFT
jgi:hypothetical protein